EKPKPLMKKKAPKQQKDFTNRQSLLMLIMPLLLPDLAPFMKRKRNLIWLLPITKKLCLLIQI
ncbi:MAG TPA: hypothetical protein PKY82_15740, partial [Pyrinomonadaceae bacterium]|nr:hypothetical protein [Pyrinomonadaceae bacterium]